MSDLHIVKWIGWNDAKSDPSLNDNFTQAHIDVLYTYIKVNNVKHGGFWHQDPDEEGVPVFNDGVAVMVTLRHWGGIVAHAFGSSEVLDYTEWAWEH